MSQKNSEFNKVLNLWDILVLAFGAMIGWAWVVSTGDWIMQGGRTGRHDRLRVGRHHDFLCRSCLCGADDCNAAKRR